MNEYMRRPEPNMEIGIPFPVHEEIVEVRTHGDITRDTISYVTYVPTTVSGFTLLLEQLHLYPLALETVLVTYSLPNTKDNPGPDLRIVITTDRDSIFREVNYLWWLDPTSVPLKTLENYLSMLKLYSDFPTVPAISSDMPISTWLEPRKKLQKVIKQQRAFLRMGKDYPSMNGEQMEHFLWEVKVSFGCLYEWPCTLPYKE